jgi:hypothetical protein
LHSHRTIIPKRDAKSHPLEPSLPIAGKELLARSVNLVNTVIHTPSTKGKFLNNTALSTYIKIFAFLYKEALVAGAETAAAQGILFVYNKRQHRPLNFNKRQFLITGIGIRRETGQNFKQSGLYIKES